MKHEFLGRIAWTIAMIAAPTTLYAQDVPDAPAQQTVSAETSTCLEAVSWRLGSQVLERHGAAAPTPRP